MLEPNTTADGAVNTQTMRTARHVLSAPHGASSPLARTAEFEIRPDAGCWTIADDRGHLHRAPASRIAIDAVLQCVQRSFELAGDAVRGCMLDADIAARSGQQSLGLGAMGPALALLVSDSRSAAWGNVGDSRIYHFRGGRIADQQFENTTRQPHVQRRALASGDAFLLCSASWWRHV